MLRKELEQRGHRHPLKVFQEELVDVHRFAKSIVMADAWAATSDKSTELNDDGTAIVAKDDKAPFHFSIDVPFAGMYALDVNARAVKGCGTFQDCNTRLVVLPAAAGNDESCCWCSIFQISTVPSLRHDTRR